MSMAQRFMPAATCSATSLWSVTPCSIDSYTFCLVSADRYFLMFFLLNTLHPKYSEVAEAGGTASTGGLMKASSTASNLV